MEMFSKALGITIFVVVLFVYPMMYHAQKYDTVTQSYVAGVTNDFVEKVRSKGEITQDDYSNFVADLNKSGNLYTIEMSYVTESVMPSYMSATLNNVETDLVEKVEIEETTDTILQELFETTSSKFKMTTGNYFSVRVYNKNKTMFTRLQQILYSTEVATKQIYVSDGGTIK